MKPKKTKPLDIVLIEWIDAQSYNLSQPNVPIEDLKEERPILTKSVGFLVSENEDCYVIADELWEETEEVRWIHIIPKCCVKEIRRVKL